MSTEVQPKPVAVVKYDLRAAKGALLREFTSKARDGEKVFGHRFEGALVHIDQPDVTVKESQESISSGRSGDSDGNFADFAELVEHYIGRHVEQALLKEHKKAIDAIKAAFPEEGVRFELCI